MTQATETRNIVVAPGDGVGPEIMAATLQILEASGAPLDIRSIQLGQQIFEQGNSSGIPDDAWDVIRDCSVLLKAPLTTPQGKGFKSVNVTLRKTLNLYANVRPCQSFHPFIASKHPQMDLVIVRENEEDLYAGIEHRHTPEVFQVLKLVSRPGCERIIRYAFEYARAYGRKRVTCMTKDNIMKLTDGLFHQVFDEIAAEYAEIDNDHYIIDIGSARLADSPERFDVIVTLNLYGDILSDIAAQIAGSVGLASSANVGQSMAMFEAVHGSAPDIAGQGIANPSGLLLAATHMLIHLGLSEQAERITNAWLKTIEDGLHTADIAAGQTAQTVGTEAFAKAVVDRLGERPGQLQPVVYRDAKIETHHSAVSTTKELIGIDVFVCWDASGRRADALAAHLQAAEVADLSLRLITNRGVKVFPDGLPETFCTDHWRCRFRSDNVVENQQLIDLQQAITNAGLEIIKTENLYNFDGQPGFSLGQGE